MNTVITPLPIDVLNDLFDEHSIKVIEFFLKELLMTKPEVLPDQEDIPIYTAQEYVEQWFVQALGATPIGAGSSPFDLYKDGSYVADIKSLTYKVNNKTKEMTNGQSGEASLGQKFDTDDGENVLDSLFSLNKGEEILNIWKEILINKYANIPFPNPDTLNKYFFFILRGNTDFYLAGATINSDNIPLLTVDEERTTENSVFVKNYIDPAYGNCKIYKAKKRMELRLRPKYWVDNDKCIKFDLPQKRVVKDLRSCSVAGQLDDYLKSKFEFVEDEEFV